MTNLEIKLEYYVGMLDGKINFLKRIIEDALIELEDNSNLDLSEVLEESWDKYNNKYAYFDPETERILLSTVDDDRVEELTDMVNRLETLIMSSPCLTPMEFETGYIHFCKTFNC